MGGVRGCTDCGVVELHEASRQSGAWAVHAGVAARVRAPRNAQVELASTLSRRAGCGVCACVCAGRCLDCVWSVRAVARFRSRALARRYKLSV